MSVERCQYLLLFSAITVALIMGCDQPTSNTAGEKAKPTTSSATAARGMRSGSKSAKPVAETEVEARVIEIISEQFGVRKSELTLNTDLRKDLKADELDRVELVMEIEDVFGLSIADEAAESWRTVRQVVDYVRIHYKR